ncbi:SDR family NAD(P)-dependent oxidoreductase [Streptomyces liangshanensis]|uniref:SDR family NAD(P)-dependent oxidoreductase n=1 Tax=Streptomyces liangshanensis TaxID=2717324 RepID=A0A6G9H4V0_9ACTN|nr:SDR family NAD(P)-dependent oxidoreductase [Streptomyces liangshanensis]QIQ05510.1 SDR family NAD(P)-dependent oxidoreductase [Streptomyces liangshanensis]
MTHRVETYEKTFAGTDSFIAQHRSAGTGILPASMQLEMAVLGLLRRGEFTPLELTDLAFLRPFAVPADGHGIVTLDVTFGPHPRFELTAGPDRKALSTGSGRPLPAAPAGVTAWEVPREERVTPEALYGSWARHGLEYGPDFRTVRDLRVADGSAEAVLRSDAEPLPWYAHPLLVDGVFQVVSCALQDPAERSAPVPLLPIGVERFALLPGFAGLTGPVTVRVRRTAVEGAYSVADALVLTPAGEVVAELTGVRMRRLPRAASPGSAALTRLATRVHWTGAPAPAPREPATGTWVVLHHGDTHALGVRTARALRAEGAEVVEVVPGGPAGAAGGADAADAAGSADAADGRRILPEIDEEAFRRLWEDLPGPVEGVVHLWNTGPVRPARDELRTGLYGALAAVKTLGERQRKARFFVVTEQAQPVADRDRPVPERAAVWGLIRTAAIEYPGLRPRLVDVGPLGSAEAAAGSVAAALTRTAPAEGDALLAELGGAGPVEIAYRDGVRHQPERVPLDGPGAALTGPDRPGVDRSGVGLPAADRPGIRRGGRYLVLGGHGGLGLEVAARFAREGAAVVGLVSRSGRGDRERLAAIEAYGCAVVSFAVDVAEPGALTAVVAGFREQFGAPHGVVHAAGTLKDGLIRGATADDVAAVLRPKADGLRELAAAVAGTDLDFAVLFASVSGTFGNLGQAGYAAANAYLDAFAHAHGAPWTSIDWGLWGEVGMGTAAADQLRRRGVRPLGTAEALDALTAALRGDVRQLVIAHADVDPRAERAERADAAVEPDGQDRPDGSGAAASDRVRDQLAAFLGERLGVAGFDRKAPLADYGINSIMSVELSEELSRRWDVRLPATLFLEYADFADLADALTERYGVSPEAPTPVPHSAVEPQAPATATATVPVTAAQAPERIPAPRIPAPQAPAPRRAPRPGDIAVVAVSGDLPGATDQAAFWRMLRSGGHAFTDVPAERWSADAHFEDRGPHMTGTYCRTGAFVSGLDRFDPKFFGVSVREAEEMDPQQKLLLEHAWSVIDDSGLAGRRDVGVFVGATYTHHRDARGLDAVGPHTALGSMNAVLANRISYALDLTGPSQTVDTLCSSSLVAVQQAVMALRTGQCGAAIVAACHVGLTPWYYRSLSQLGALSPTLPRPFDDRADGFVPGEGAIAVVLKPLADAERDGDRVLGVVKGAAVNHGGRGSALPVPRSEAQVAVIRAALADAEVPASDITLVETHGTATRLGDPIEIAALAEVFGGDDERQDPCFLGSVKANIGHLEPASGLAGLVKVLLCLRHQEIPPLAGYETPGTHVDLAAGPFVVPTEPLPWPSRADRPRRAGISAFGMGGTNAHVVVEEYVAPVAPAHAASGPPRAHLLVLSGHTPEALARRAGDVARLLAADPAPDPGALCFSAAVGRDHLPHRIAVLGATAAGLRTALEQALRAPVVPGTVVRGDTPEDHDLTRLAHRYTAGEKVDWRRTFDTAPPRRVPLPPYPFRDVPDPVPDTAAPDALGEVAARVTRAHRVFGDATVPAALLLARGWERHPVLERISLLARGVGEHPLVSDLDDRVSQETVTFRYGDLVIARLTPGLPVPVPDLDTPPADSHRLDALRAAHTRTMEPDGLYAWFAAKGMDLAAPLRSITHIHYSASGVLARIGGEDESQAVRTVAALDAALQSMAVLTLADPAAFTSTYLPVSVGRAVRRSDPARTRYVHLRAVEQEPDGTRRGDVTLLAADGEVLATLGDVVYRPLPNAGPVPGGARTVARSPLVPVVGEEAVTRLVRTVLRDPDVRPDTSLSSAGLDSMLATLVAAEIEEELGVRLGPTDVLAARDCRALAAMVAELAPEPARGAEVAEADVQAERPSSETAFAEWTPAEQTPVEPAHAEPVHAQPAPAEPVQAEPVHAQPPVRARDMAVIGLACALPGATGPERFWELLSRGGNGVGQAPPSRWRGADPGRTAAGGFLDDIEEFDARFFDFFPKQAEVLDPQARWLLRTTWEALESAGLPAASVPARTGVFVGASYQHYKDQNIAPELDAPSGLGNHNAFLANRVSYFLDLRGPSMTIDTLCSSSLVALHTAVRSIRDGECDQAVVAGVRLAMSPLHYAAMDNLRALSPTGASRAFDASADGFVPGEGVVTVVIKPLADALRDGDRVRGVIKGSAVNHGGRGSGLTVPNSAAQDEVIAQALNDAGVTSESVAMVEAHGTGTTLGDPIEVDGLTRAWRRHTDRTQFCAIGSSKSNIGHLEPAAGLAGLVKVLLALEHEEIPPTLHVTRPNDHIRFEDTPFYVADRPIPWPRTDRAPRRGAVSAFGMGGVNAHVVVEEAPALPPRGPLPAREHVLRVSGATEEAVRRLAAAYADRFAASAGDRETADLCHSANVGRSPLSRTTTVRGRGAAGLVAELRALADGRPFTAEPHRDPAFWASLSAPGSRITDLPTYPFARGRHWHIRPEAAPAAPVPPAAAPTRAEPVPADSATPEAWRLVWRAEGIRPAPDGVGDPFLRSAAVRGAVRVVAADRDVTRAVTAALRDLGVSVAEEEGVGGPVGPDSPVEGLVVVADAPVHPDVEAGLGAFWADLRAHVTALPAGGKLLWADRHSAVVLGAERAGLRPDAAARVTAVRAAGAENTLAVTTLDLDPDAPAASQAALVAAEFAALRPGDNAAVAYRRGARFVPERVAAVPAPPAKLTVDGYYLVTGGLGAVGRQLAGHLIDRGAKRVGIIGRSVIDTARSAPLAELRRRAEVDYLPCDIADEGALASVAARFGQGWGRLLGVVHSSGGVNPFGAVRRRAWADTAKVTEPKIAGSRHAVRLAKAEGAEFAVLVSSIAGVRPEAGRGLVDYALANAYQLALAERENGPDTAVTAHAWPNWSGTGMAASESYAAAHALTVDQALEGFAGHLRSGGSVVFPGSALPAPAAGSEPPTGTPIPAKASSPTLPTAVPAAAPTSVPTVPPGAGGRTAETMAGFVRAAFLHVLGEDPGHRILPELGLDSLAIAELATAIEQRSGRTVDPSFLMRARTVDDLGARLAAAEAGTETGAGTGAGDPVSPEPGRPPEPGGAARTPDSALSALLRPLLTPDQGR